MANEKLKERLKKKRAALGSSGSKGNVLYIEEGTTRVRILPTKGEDFVAEVSHVYLNKELKGVYSAISIGQPCPLDEAYQELKKSKDEEDQDLAKKLSPRLAYLIPVLVYEDEKGKKVDKEKSGKLMKIASGVYQTLIDLYLDEDEWGDMTDPKKGYDVKIIRTGKGMNDTEYSVVACKNTPIDKDWAKPFDLDNAVKAIFEPYDTVKQKVETFLGLDIDDDKKDKKSKKSKLKKAKNDFSSSDKKDKKDKDKKPLKSKDKKVVKSKKSKK